MELQQLTAVGNKTLLSLMAQLIFVDALTLQGRKVVNTPLNAMLASSRRAVAC
jgi:hypothetical protein